jgi:hypothetical protein
MSVRSLAEAVLSVDASRYSIAGERAPVFLTNVVDRADAGMIQCRGGLRFAVERSRATGSFEM